MTSLSRQLRIPFAWRVADEQYVGPDEVLQGAKATVLDDA